jgi:hypothetical protein
MAANLGAKCTPDRGARAHQVRIIKASNIKEWKVLSTPKSRGEPEKVPPTSDPMLCLPGSITGLPGGITGSFARQL